MVSVEPAQCRCNRFYRISERGYHIAPVLNGSEGEKNTKIQAWGCEGRRIADRGGPEARGPGTWREVNNIREVLIWKLELGGTA